MAWTQDIEKVKNTIWRELESLDEHVEKGNMPFGLEYFNDVTGEPDYGKAQYRHDMLHLYWRLLGKEVGKENVIRCQLRLRKGSNLLIFVKMYGVYKERAFKVVDFIPEKEGVVL
jgi:hypothetical protein